MNDQQEGADESLPFSLKHFRKWMICFVVCNFNVDVGPEIESVYPPTPLASSDLSAICFNSFPERHEGEITEDLSFSFALRNHSPKVSFDAFDYLYGKQDYFHGTCLFRQEQDNTVKRRFGQKSLVLLSQHDFPGLWVKLLHLMTSNNALGDIAVLETACMHVASWKPPTAGQHQLPFFGSVLAMDISPNPALPLQGLIPSSTGSREIFTPIFDVSGPVGNWYKLVHYLPSLAEIYIIFEQAILAEPVAVLSKNPQICSEFVSAVVDLIRPVPYAGDSRPYITMQSDLFSTEIDGGLPQHYMIGITNPFLLRRLSVTSGNSGHREPHIVYLRNPESEVPLKPSHQEHNLRGDHQVPQGSSRPKQTKTHLSKDTAFLKSLSRMISGSNPLREENSDVAATVRRHFAALAGSLLAPLNRYFATLTDSPSASPGGEVRYGNFSEADFLQSLSKYGCSVKFRGTTSLQRQRTRDAFYKRFCQSPSFFRWLDMKTRIELAASTGVSPSDPTEKGAT
ncbi:hypothetical protein L228DRAFT_269350 [Xylona heveae TC161]|uniref:UDENN domain-containing protein n=1 Tax=Xylona heveae (strain CBS 132557 / TC161) TaxID=1328760 RepID=A0A165G9F8_XYLHT|nr:hypothetical protein L228DRAFT_269350 [Xylona heveae TC161]KZF21902.1 hypothetical protein L228DRAFT_269350 [Xylona heveae TC161]